MSGTAVAAGELQEKLEQELVTSAIPLNKRLWGLTTSVLVASRLAKRQHHGVSDLRCLTEMFDGNLVSVKREELVNSRAVSGRLSGGKR